MRGATWVSTSKTKGKKLALNLPVKTFVCFKEKILFILLFVDVVEERVHSPLTHHLVHCFKVHAVFYIQAILHDPFTQRCLTCVGSVNSGMVDFDDRLVYRWLRLKWTLWERVHCHFACCELCCSKPALGAGGVLTAVCAVATLQRISTALLFREETRPYL